MQYVGGKTRAAKHIVAEIQARAPAHARWWDPFCGGLSMSVALTEAYGPGTSSDACVPLVALYQAVAGGWDPPSVLTLEEYQAAKALPDTDPLKAFAGFGCSFGGKWFRGYAWDSAGRSYAAIARRSLLRGVAIVRRFASGSFFDVEPGPKVDVLYLDPPYRGTLGYGAVEPFDHARFDARAVAWAQAGVHVFVSEYTFPHGELIWEREQRMTLARGASKAATERLFYLAPR